jgi:hypothetical protein
MKAAKKTQRSGNPAFHALEGAKTHASAKQKGFRAGVVVFGATVALYALMFPLYRLGDYLLCGGLALLISRAVSAIADGWDAHTQEKPTDDSDAVMLTGDAVADEVISRGQEMIHNIREENRLNTDETLSGKMNELERVSVRILKAIEEKPHKAGQVRRFLDYYLPTTLKMLKNGRLLNERELKGDDADRLRRNIASGVDAVIDACGRLLDHLYQDTYLDVGTDIDVLRQMLKRDGLADGDFIIGGGTPVMSKENDWEV